MNVADDRIFGARPRPARNGAFHLMYHGQVTHRYGLDLAVRCGRTAPARGARHPPHRLGTGDQVDGRRAAVAEFDLADAVELCQESCPGQELPGIIAAADLGVVPYRDDVFTDGIVPTKLMEYAGDRPALRRRGHQRDHDLLLRRDGGALPTRGRRRPRGTCAGAVSIPGMSGSVGTPKSQLRGSATAGR